MAGRILYLAASDGVTLEQSGGAGTHMRGTIKGFRENGYEVLPIIGGNVFGVQPAIQTAGNDSGKRNFRNSVKRILPDKVRLLMRELRTFARDYKLQSRTFHEIKSFHPDFIYERASYFSLYGTRLAKKLKIPHLFETDGCMVEIISEDFGVFSKRLGNRIEKYKLDKADYVVVMNKLAIEVVARKFNIPTEKFVVKTLGIDVPHYIQNDGLVEELKLKYTLQNKFVVGFVGIISTYHGMDYLIDAAGYLQSIGNKNIIFLIIGWSAQAELLKRIAEEKNLRNIIFVGKVDKSQVPYYYKLFNLGIIPNAEPGIYPIKVLEYGINKVCPLVPDYQVFHQIIVENETGFYFRPKDPRSLGSKVVDLSERQQDTSRSGENWYKYVNEKFKWKDTVKDVIKLFPLE